MLRVLLAVFGVMAGGLCLGVAAAAVVTAIRQRTGYYARRAHHRVKRATYRARRWRVP